MTIKTRFGLPDALAAALTIVIVLASGLTHYDLWDLRYWRVPPHFDSDSLHLLALFKSVSRGECWPYTSFLVSGLGAPFVANWNDFPITCPALLLSGGFLTKWFGLGIAANSLLVIAHITSALAMFISLRFSEVNRLWSVVFAVCYGLAPFLFYRGLTHLVLTFAYSVPITVALCYLIYKKGSSLLKGWNLLLVCAVAFYFGGIFPYYTAFFLMVMGFSALYCMLNEKTFAVIIPFFLIAFSALAHFYIVTEPFRQYSRENGENPFAVSRFYSNLQLNALRPVEMLLPGSSSRLPVLKQLSAFYENQDIFRNEFQFTESMQPYLGVPAIIGLAILFGLTGYFVFTRQQQKIPGWFWFVGFFMAFAIVGGLNGILGLAKFFMLRSSNRVSIYITAACIFFLALLLTQMSRRMPKTLQGTIASMFVALALFEALPVAFSRDAGAAQLYTSDQQMVANLESLLPANAMVFNFPVIDFPESGTYAHLRPYLFTDSLRFSFGSVKGRARETWQREIAKESPIELADKLKELGFSGILVYRGADLAAADKESVDRFLSEISTTQATRFVSPERDFLFFALTPSPSTTLPKIQPQFLGTWWPETIQPFSLSFPTIASLRWCAQFSGEIEIFNAQSQPRDFLLQCSVISICDTTIKIAFGKEKLKEINLRAGEVEPISINLTLLKPGASRIQFRSTAHPSMVEGRKFNFGISNLEIRAVSEKL